MKTQVAVTITLDPAEMRDPSRLAVSILEQIGALTGRPMQLPADDEMLRRLIESTRMEERRRCWLLVEEAARQLERFDESVRAPVLRALLAIRGDQT